LEFLIKNHVKPDAKILLIKLRSLGDVIHNTSVYGPIKKYLPNSRLTVIVESASYDIVKNHPDVDEVLCFDKSSFIKKAKFYFNLIRNPYDVAIDMHEGTRGAVMCFISRAKFKVGNIFAKRSYLYNTKINFSDLKPSLPIDYQVALISKLGVPFENPKPIVNVSEAWRKRGRELLIARNFDPDQPFCIIHPGARKYDQWQFEKFAEITEYFFKRFKLGIILTCGPGQLDQVENLTQCLSKEVPFTFISTELSVLLGITSSAKFVVCHNGGYMHAASAIGVPTTALFGLTDYRIWKPLGEKSVVLHGEIDCWPCTSKTMKRVCWDGKPECKELISAENVINSIKKLCPDFADK
tara:strand:- start:3706 stop:4764 length:1059 start_codon:yes stop_codon:yes gene_type:complete